ncbi:hypothetical protein [Chitinophaga arvensicola]|nr:hypothetical protein [Chitinophaga arvensicola]
MLLSGLCSQAQKLFDQLTVPKDGPEYYVTIDGKGPYRVKINDIPFFTFEKGDGSMTFIANHAIPSSGEQQIAIEAEPGSNIREASISRHRWTAAGSQLDSVLWKSNQSFSGIFYATVPHDLIGWKKSRDISSNEQLRKAAATWFSDMITLLKAHKGKEFMDRIMLAEQQSFIMNYVSAKEAKVRHKGWESYINKGKFEVGNEKDDQVEIVGNGQLIHLRGSNNQGGIKLLSSDGQTTYMDIFLHFPSDKQLPEAIMINYRQETSDFRKRIK